MILDVAREVHCAGAVHRAVDLHVAVDNVQVFLFVLEQNRGDTFSFVTDYSSLEDIKRCPQTKSLLGIRYLLKSSARGSISK